VVVQTGLIEEEYEAQKGSAVFQSAPRFIARGGLPFYRRPPRDGRARRPAVRVLPPAQTLRPRVRVVRRPLRLGFHDDDP
jgi:hypothetical protein